MKYLIVSKKIWDQNNFNNKKSNIVIKKNISKNLIRLIKPKIIFFIFWSKKIPESIYNNHLCIQFHTSDLPKFRGGSPVQNQIIKGITKTKISAFRVISKIDQGEICLKKKINLKGSAQEIYLNIEKKIFFMINKLIKKKKIKFYKQIGKPSYFKRRKPSDSEINLNKIKNLKEIYNLIRSTDATTYPKAYLNFNNFKIDLFDASLYKTSINAKIKITKKK